MKVICFLTLHFTPDFVKQTSGLQRIQTFATVETDLRRHFDNRSVVASSEQFLYFLLNQLATAKFFMWWDLFSSTSNLPTLDKAALEVLEQIIALPSAKCQRAALHGLNHLESPAAAAVIRQFLARNQASMAPKDVEYAMECMRGLAS
jgi:hypothetical protein